MNFRIKFRFFFFLVLLAFFVASCNQKKKATVITTSGTTSSPTTVSALAMKEKISVVEPKASTTSAAKSLSIGYPGINKAIVVADISADAAYKVDETDIFVYEQSASALNGVNNIMCYFAQAKAGYMLNKGNYKAQVDDGQCESKGGNNESDNKSSGANSVTYSYWTVNSSRVDNNSPQIIKAWVTDSSGAKDAQQITAKLTITKAKSSTNPFGIFRLDFLSHPVVKGVVDTSYVDMQGYIESSLNTAGELKLHFINHMEQQGQSLDESVSFTQSLDGKTGKGTTSGLDWGQGGKPTVKVFDFSYNDNYFFKQDASGNQVCLDRNNFHEVTWRYGLYDAKGDRVTRSSGFPAKVTVNGKEFYGYIGYWGIWFPAEAGVKNGSTVTRQTFGSKKETQYTVVQIPGKLIKHTRKTLTLDGIKNIPLNWSNNKDNTEYRVIWNGTILNKTASRSAKNNFQWSDIPNGSPVKFTDTDFEFFFWSEALGGEGQIKLEKGKNIKAIPTVNGKTPVIFYVSEPSFPGDAVPASLICYSECPDPKGLDSSADSIKYFKTGWESQTGIKYTFDSTNFLLQQNGVNVTTANNVNKWGVWSGPLFEDTAANLALLKCDWDSTQLCAWKAYEVLTSFYTWETGANEWNQFTTIKDAAGKYQKFEAPISLKYTHKQTNPAKSDFAFNGTTFYLEYSGFGNLDGIPTTCIDTATGLEVSCFDATLQKKNIRWIPKFVISNGASVTDAKGTEFLVKALDKEQTMIKVNSAVCTNAGLSLASETLPTIKDAIDPKLGAEPVVDAAPAVIGGVIQ